MHLGYIRTSLRFFNKNAYQSVALSYLISVNGFVQMGFSMSNWQKVQLNTDLFSDKQKYLYTN